MIRLWLTFFVFAILIHASITAWRSLSGLEKWSLTKTIGYSIIIALLTLAMMTIIVILF